MKVSIFSKKDHTFEVVNTETGEVLTGIRGVYFSQVFGEPPKVSIETECEVFMTPDSEVIAYECPDCQGPMRKKKTEEREEIDLSGTPCCTCHILPNVACWHSGYTIFVCSTCGRQFEGASYNEAIENWERGNVIEKQV